MRRSALLVCLTLVWSAGTATAETPAEWLVHLARDYGLAQREAPTPADLEHVSVLLEAARRMEPESETALTALLELALLRGDDDAVADLLDDLCQAAPQRSDAAAYWLDAELRRLQTLEKRQRRLAEIIADGDASAVLKAQACVRLAQLARDRLEADSAAQWLERAADFQPHCPDAVLARFEWLTATAAPAERLSAALGLLTLNPLHVEAAWEAALALDQAGLPAEAAEFFQHAAGVYETVHGVDALPAGYLLDLAHNALARGETAEALDLTQRAWLRDSRRYEAAALLHWLYQSADRDADANALQRRLSDRFAQVRDPNLASLSELAQAAWFHCRIDPQPHRALSLARAAAGRAGEDRFVRRVLGWAQALNLEDEAAERTLEPIVDEDPYAAYMWAKVRRERGDDAAQIADRLAPYWRQPLVGPARTLLDELRPAATTQPATQPADRAGVEAALRDFDERTLAFYRMPERFLRVTATPTKPSFAPGAAWRFTFSVTNTGPTPLALGPGWTANPLLLLSFASEGDRPRSYPALLSVAFAGTRVLAPGESLTRTRRLDVGPLARFSAYTPQQLQRITLEVVFDPVQLADGRWEPALPTMRLDPVYFNRTPAQTTPDAIRALLATIRAAQPGTASAALHAAAALVGEQQRAALGRLSYQPAALDVGPLLGALRATLAQGERLPRLYALDALQVMGLDAASVRLVARLLDDDDWLTRLLALRLLARQGPAFADRAVEIAANDADELVRRLAQCYLSQWKPAADESAAGGRATQTP